MLKIVIGTNEGKVLCISSNEDEIKASMVNYLIDTDQEPTEDFFESQNLGEYDIQVYEYHQPQLNENQQMIFNELKTSTDYYKFNKFQAVYWMLTNLISYPDGLIAKAYKELEQYELEQVFQVFSQFNSEQEEE